MKSLLPQVFIGGKITAFMVGALTGDCFGLSHQQTKN